MALGAGFASVALRCAELAWGRGQSYVTCNVTGWRKLLSKSDRTKSIRERVRAHRRRLRQQGLRPIQIWVPDVRSESFQAEAHRQSLAVAESSYAQEDQEFVDAVSEFGDE